MFYDQFPKAQEPNFDDNFFESIDSSRVRTAQIVSIPHNIEEGERMKLNFTTTLDSFENQQKSNLRQNETIRSHLNKSSQDSHFTLQNRKLSNRGESKKYEQNYELTFGKMKNQSLHDSPDINDCQNLKLTEKTSSLVMHNFDINGPNYQNHPQDLERNTSSVTHQSPEQAKNNEILSYYIDGRRKTQNQKIISTEQLDSTLKKQIDTQSRTTNQTHFGQRSATAIQVEQTKQLMPEMKMDFNKNSKTTSSIESDASTPYINGLNNYLSLKKHNSQSINNIYGNYAQSEHSINANDDAITQQSTMLLKSTKEDKEREMKENILILGLQRPAMVADKDRKTCLIYPNDRFKVIFWDLIISICLLITCILIPFNMAFGEYLDGVQWYNVFLFIIDAFFVCDIFVNFNTAVVKNEVHIITNRKMIAIEYFKTWFLIDLLSVIPFDVIFELSLSNDLSNGGGEQQGNTKLNQYVRISRVSKLYKLIKITRMFRLFKLMKQKEQIVRKMKNLMQFGQTIERLSFFLMLLFLMTHFIGCLWIFIGNTFQDDEVKDDSWIEIGEHQSDDIMELYILSVYFTMQTLTTVGYGDFNITSSAEKIMTIILQLVGIISFSFIAGAITNIIHGFDEENAKNQEKLNVLHRLYDEHPMPPDLYYALLAQIQNVDDKKLFNETIQFLDQLPFRLKLMTTKFIYRKQYLQIKYLKLQNENFLVWICPLLKQEFILTEQYLYYQTDMINEIYFLTSGTAGFVLPLRKNVVYIEINQGDHFGEIDLVFAAQDKLMPLDHMIECMNYQNDFNLQRVFTVQAIEDCTLLSLSTQNLQRMQKQFNSQFNNLFKGADHCLQNALKQKGSTLLKCDKKQTVTMKKYRRKKKVRDRYKQYNIDIPDNSHKDHNHHNNSDHLNKKQQSAIRYFKRCKMLAHIRDDAYHIEQCKAMNCHDDKNSSEYSRSHINTSRTSKHGDIEEDLNKQKSIKDIFKLINPGKEGKHRSEEDSSSSCHESECSQTRKQTELEDKLKEKMIEQNKMDYERMKKNQEQIKNIKMQEITEYNESEEGSETGSKGGESLKKRPNVKKPSMFMANVRSFELIRQQQRLKSQKTIRNLSTKNGNSLLRREKFKKRKMSVADIRLRPPSHKKSTALSRFSSNSINKAVYLGSPYGGIQDSNSDRKSQFSPKRKKKSPQKSQFINLPELTASHGASPYSCSISSSSVSHDDTNSPNKLSPQKKQSQNISSSINKSSSISHDNQ